MIVFWNFRFVLQLLFDVKYSVQERFRLRLPQHSIVLSRDIHLVSAALSLPYIYRWCGITAHLFISSFPPPLSPSHFSYFLSLLLSPFPHTFTSVLSYLGFHFHTVTPPTNPLHISLHRFFFLSVPNPLVFSLSFSLHCVLMNCLPLLVNSTDNPGEAVKDHRSALQTGPQATALEQHANNKPLHLAHSLCICVHVCMSQI